jgi:hypothetical protein
VGGLELIRRVKDPLPSTVKFATLGRKPAPGNLAVGGLPMELLVYQLVNTYVPSQYGSLTLMDKGSISPGVSPEDAIKFNSVVLPPGVQVFVLRPVEHPLNYRRAPTIHISSHVKPSEGHVYGPNRPEQTGEEHSHGFRTTEWSPSLQPPVFIQAVAFIPSTEVASLNTPKANQSYTTAAVCKKIHKYINFCTFIYVYVCIYIYIYIYTSVYVYIYIYIYIVKYMYINIHI